MRAFLFAALLGITLGAADHLLAAAGDAIIPETTAQRHGLTRPWLTQIQVDRGRGRVRDIILYEGTLYVQTNRAVIHAIDAETGQSLWAKQIGHPEHPSVCPGANFDLLATVNGQRLYVMNRYNGDVLYETDVKGAPGAGPVLSRKRVYVPLVTGMVLSYRLEPITDPNKELGKIEKIEGTEEEKKAKLRALEEERRQNIRLAQSNPPPLVLQSCGRILTQPTMTYQDANEEFVSWVTDRGYLNVGRIDRRDSKVFELKFRVHADTSMAASAGYQPPIRNSSVPEVKKPAAAAPAKKEALEDEADKHAEAQETAAPADEAADPLGTEEKPAPAKKPAAHNTKKPSATAALNTQAELGIIYCTSLDGYVRAHREKTGEELWRLSTAEPIVEPAAVVEERVYAATQSGGMYCLDAKTGKQHWWAAEIVRFLAQSQQRVYAADKRGQTIVLDAKSGGRIDVLPTQMLPIKLTNRQTDRLYLGTETGLLQCLHEVEQTQPIVYGADRKPPPEEEKKVEKPKPGVKATDKARDKPQDKPKPKPKKVEDDFGGVDPLAEEAEKPAKKQPPAKAPPKEKKPAKAGKAKKSDAEDAAPDFGAGAPDFGAGAGEDQPAAKPGKKAKPGATKPPKGKAVKGKQKAGALGEPQ